MFMIVCNYHVGTVNKFVCTFVVCMYKFIMHLFVNKFVCTDDKSIYKFKNNSFSDELVIIKDLMDGDCEERLVGWRKD